MKKISSACIIDDDDIFIYGTRRIMQEVRFCDDIVVYKNGKEAIEGMQNYLKEGKKLPDVIFLDINMPVMNGWDFLEEFMSIPNLNEGDILLYVVSSSIDPADLQKAKEFKLVSNYILKPIMPKQLNEIIGAPAD
ncbi:response regulator [Croceitalea sp. MTPC9]|uniref:response regulator n=1 Tax=unclassified Croceitalea TaxID=2632280 RepID=UPI002B3CF3CE|nr:response regulator [Croceitalea sp. MTPC6]GMN16834.1 response regulator [Croceitalea sp. MTPC9]